MIVPWLKGQLVFRSNEAGKPMDNTNGTLIPPQNRLDEILLSSEPLTSGYRPTLPLWALGIGTDTLLPHLYLRRDIELMLIHPMVRAPLSYFKAGISGAQFWGGESEDGNPKGRPISIHPEVAKFCHEQVQRFWDRGVPKMQHGYDYGWLGAENMYVEDQGRFRWDDCLTFSPLDTYLLTQGSDPAGVRIKNIRGKGSQDLWLSSDDVPAKALWYPHMPRYSSLYGQSQLFGAWRPWRRLAAKDGGEQNLDMAMYKYGIKSFLVRYPEEDGQTAAVGAPATLLDSQGRPRRSARDVARQIGEYLKSGAVIGLPSTRYPNSETMKWSIDTPDHAFNMNPLIDGCKYLERQVSYGIGFPPELLEAGEQGGYNGRVIPLEGFFAIQQQIADAFLWLFVKQVLKPLVLWNFGDVPFEVKVKNLLTSRRESGQQQKPGESQPGASEPFGQQQQVQPGQQPVDPRMQPNAAFSLTSVLNERRRLARFLIAA